MRSNFLQLNCDNTVAEDSELKKKLKTDISCDILRFRMITSISLENRVMQHTKLLFTKNRQ